MNRYKILKGTPVVYFYDAAHSLAERSSEDYTEREVVYTEDDRIYDGHDCLNVFYYFRLPPNNREVYALSVRQHETRIVQTSRSPIK